MLRPDRELAGRVEAGRLELERVDPLADREPLALVLVRGRDVLLGAEVLGARVAMLPTVINRTMVSHAHCPACRQAAAPGGVSSPASESRVLMTVV